MDGVKFEQLYESLNEEFSHIYKIYITNTNQRIINVDIPNRRSIQFYETDLYKNYDYKYDILRNYNYCRNFMLLNGFETNEHSPAHKNRLYGTST